MMGPMYFVTATLLFASLVLVSAHVPAKRETTRRALPPIDALQITQGQSQQIDVTNATYSVSLVRTNRIQCFSPLPGRPQATIEGCRATLNKFRTFPLYRLKQDFQENRYPRQPDPPPFVVYDHQCIVGVKALDPRIVDKFSFEQIRALAFDIIEDCSDHGGVGGIAPIGSKLGWVVTLKGIKMDNGTAIAEVREE